MTDLDSFREFSYLETKNLDFVVVLTFILFGIYYCFHLFSLLLFLFLLLLFLLLFLLLLLLLIIIMLLLFDHLLFRGLLSLGLFCSFFLVFLN